MRPAPPRPIVLDEAIALRANDIDHEVRAASAIANRAKSRLGETRSDDTPRPVPHETQVVTKSFVGRHREIL
jgi:hypothetical protein